MIYKIRKVTYKINEEGKDSAKVKMNPKDQVSESGKSVRLPTPEAGLHTTFRDFPLFL